MRVSERCRRVLILTLPEETLLDAAARMRRYEVSALPVYRRHRLVGIVTERDVVAAIADGADPAATRVADYMTDRPVTVRPDEDVEVAARRMAELGVRHLPVVDGDQLVGVLSMRDLLAPAATPASAVAPAPGG
jgi:CBS domain-containing protein